MFLTQHTCLKKLKIIKKKKNIERLKFKTKYFILKQYEPRSILK